MKKRVYILKVIIFLIILNGCKLDANKIEQNESAGTIYNEAIKQISTIKGIDKAKLPAKLDEKKEITSEKLKNTIQKLINFLNNKEIFKDELNESEMHSYALIKHLIKNLNSSKTLSKKEIKKLEDALDKSSPKIKKQLEVREIFKNFLSLLKTVDPDNDKLIKKILNEHSYIYLLQDKLSGTTILHDAIKIIPFNEEDKDPNKSIGKEDQLFRERLKKILKHIFIYSVNDKEKLKQAFRTYDKNKKYEKLPLHIAAEKNLIKILFQYITELNEFYSGDIKDLLGFNENYNNKNNPLHSAMSRAAKESAIKLIEEKPEFTYQTNKLGQNPLHLTNLNSNTQADFLSSILIDKNNKFIKQALNTLDNTKDKNSNKGKTPLHRFIELLKIRWGYKNTITEQDHPSIRALEVLIENKSLIGIAKSKDGKRTLTKTELKSSLLIFLKKDKDIIITENKNKKLYDKAYKLIENL